ncbi:hypothetical protein C8R43DRAFT_944889 [Mycena crocata]|nr:hypothetical protein C8R43DRAFT_944889 [Mycena crocata]
MERLDSRCHACQTGTIRAARPSTGKFTPENWGRFYQSCTRNNFKENTLCATFWWRNDIPRLQQASTIDPPPGPPPVPPPGPPPLLPMMPVSSIPPPQLPPTPASTPRRRPKQNCTNASCQQLGHHGGHSHAQKHHLSLLVICWWTQNHMDPLVFDVPAPSSFPYFHPKQIPLVVELVGSKNCLNFVYWNGSEWKHTNDKIKVKRNVDILLRSRDVTHCLGGPQPKPRASYTPTPLHSLDSSSRPAISPINFDVDIDDDDNEDPPAINQPSTLTPSSGPIVVPHPSSPSPSSRPPSGRRFAGQFPQTYACEMDAGFSAMALFNGKVPEKFEEAFNTEFVRGTYYSHHNQWKAMKDHSLLAAAIKCGQADGGEWATLLRHFGKRVAQGSYGRKWPSAETSPGYHSKKKHNKEHLNPSPPFYEEAIAQIVGEQIAVDWDWVANLQGEGDRVSEKVRQFVDDKLIVLPADQNHLTIQPRPQPSLLTRHLTWGGTKEEFDEERNDLFWKLVSHDPTCNSIDYDPKIIVLNHLGNDEHEFFAKRFHHPELNEAVRYLGRRKEGAEDEPAGTVTNKLELQELDLTCHVLVSVRTRKLIEKVILFGRTIMPGEAPGYYVYWTLPGVNAGEKWGPLYIYNPEDSDEGKWGPGIDGRHCIPALGPNNALRIMLVVDPLPSSQYLSDEERITVLFVQYLQCTHGHDQKIEEICDIFHSKDHTKRNAGRTPAQWTSWLPSIAAIMEDKEVPEDASETDIAGKKITQVHVAAFLGCRSNWVSSALKAHGIISGRNRNLPGMVYFWSSLHCH